MSSVGSGPAVSPFIGDGEMARLGREFDWAAGPLGPVSGWSASLRGAVSICLSSRFPMWMAWGPQLIMLYNDAYRRDTLGIKHPWALGRPAWEVWSEIWPDIGPRIRSVLETGVATWDEGLLLFLERSGYREETYHTFSYSPLREDSGQVAGMLCVVSEDTRQVLGERWLRVLRELAEAPTAADADQACQAAIAVLAGHRDSLPCALAYLRGHDAPVTLRLVASHGVNAESPGMRRVVGRSEARGLWRVVEGGRAEPRAESSEGYTDALEPSPLGDATPASMLVLPLTGQTRSGPVGVVVLGVSPYRELDGAYRAFLELVAGHISTAIADAMASEAERRRAEELAELDRAKTEFFTGVSHELRTPLTLIAGPALDALADTDHPLAADQRARLELISSNAGRLRRMVDTLLEFSRLQAGRLTPTPMPVDLAGLTRGIAEAFAPAARRAGLDFAVSCPPLGSTVLVDVDMWEKIVVNLLSNAVKYTPSGRVSLGLERAADGTLRLDVTDTGIGIAAAEQPRLFERFHRVPGAAGRSFEGSGIGLALVSELAALHGGTTAVHSAPGQGSRFTVTLPEGVWTKRAPKPWQPSATAGLYRDEALRWSHDTPDAPDTPDTREPGGSGLAVGVVGTGAGGTAGRPTVLVVEDNAELRQFLTGVLRARYRVVVAGDGEEGLRRARSVRPDLVLTDVMMPKMDGFALLAALRADPATATLPVIVLSARAGQDAIGEGLAAGADDYLVKPFTSPDLLVRIHANITMARLRRRDSDTLQRSLLPARVPQLPRLTIATSYQPAGQESQAGGDWYDVIALDDEHVAIAVGDVVGSGIAAAAAMGQLRSALSLALMHTRSPARALELLSRFTDRVEGAAGSTAVCLVLNTRTGALRWSAAGHPPPVLLDPTHSAAPARLLSGGGGRVLGHRTPRQYTDAHQSLPAGATILLYTDGLIERRGEHLDRSFDRLLHTLAPHATAAPADLLEAARTGLIQHSEPADDVAIVAARLLPGPLSERIPAALPAHLSGIRRRTANWAATAGLGPHTIMDLQLALGEALANTIEHAYPPDSPGELFYRIAHLGAGFEVEVRDQGRWRPEPDNNSHRGRGLFMIRAVGSDVSIEGTEHGTTVRFLLPVPTPGGTSGTPATTGIEPVPAAGDDDRPASSGPVCGRDTEGTTTIRLTTDIDHATIESVRRDLQHRIHRHRGPIRIDLTDLTYLGSAGVRVLSEVLDQDPARITIHTTPGTPSEHVLQLTGLDQPGTTSGPSRESPPSSGD